MRLGLIASLILVALPTGTPIYAAEQAKTTPIANATSSKVLVSPPGDTNPTTPLVSLPLNPTEFCGEVGLSDDARVDCQARMNASSNDAERAEVERTFGMGNGIERTNASTGAATNIENSK